MKQVDIDVPTVVVSGHTSVDPCNFPQGEECCIRFISIITYAFWTLLVLFKHLIRNSSTLLVQLCILITH